MALQGVADDHVREVGEVHLGLGSAPRLTGMAVVVLYGRPARSC